MSRNGSARKSDSTKIMERLKLETKEYHSRLESLPYFKALMEHRLPLECYINQLRALSVIHGVLENEMASTKDPQVSAIWNDELRKLSLLEEDLAFFKPRVVSDAADSTEAALAMAEKIRLRSVEKPLTLLGYLYVFEGSTLGNSMHRPDISATFHLDQMNGCRYYSSYQEDVQIHWRQFSQKVNRTLKDPASHDSLVEAAHEAFAGLEVLYGTLYPPAKSEKMIHVTRINPEAGNHPIPEDEREIEAALKASDRGWAEFPYYMERYGERGKRFSDSDTCWLVTLTSLDPKILQRQIDWLCRVLATRGMPTLMMEQTLRFLCEELCRAVPDNAAVYEKLRISADELKKNRERHMPDEVFQSLADEFERSVGSEGVKLAKNTGKLIVSAVLDEKNGIAGTVNALEQWLTDADRFSKEWIRGVKETVGKARRHVAE